MRRLFVASIKAGLVREARPTRAGQRRRRGLSLMQYFD